MRYKVNPTINNCMMKVCECKECHFNGIDRMCIDCNECLDHKMLIPVRNCSIIKKGDWDGFCAAAVHDSYMICVPMGICDIPEYLSITKEEFDTFEEWKNNESKILEIENRQGLI